MNVSSGLSITDQYGDGLSPHQYVGSNPNTNRDPTGLYVAIWDDVDDIAAQYYADREAAQIEIIAQARVLAAGFRTQLKAMADRMILEIGATALWAPAPYAFAAFDTVHSLAYILQHGLDWNAGAGLAANLYAAKFALDVGASIGIKARRGQKSSAGLGIDISRSSRHLYLRNAQANYRRPVSTKLRVLQRVCFAAGTPVLMADGSLRAIETVQVGDWVACDLDPGENNGAEPCRVTRIFARSTDALLDLVVSHDNKSTTVRTTPEHPFFVPARNGYVRATDLVAGVALRSESVDAVVVTADRLRADAETVYNLEVADGHNYFVSDAQLLVHNTCWVLQTGGHTIRPGTARALNKELGMALHPREWGRAMEDLKDWKDLANAFHGTKIWSNGNITNADTGKYIGNLLDFVN